MPRGPRPWARFDPFHRGDLAPARERGAGRESAATSVSSPVQPQPRSQPLSALQPPDDDVASSVATILDVDETPGGVIAIHDLQPSFGNDGLSSAVDPHDVQPSLLDEERAPDFIDWGLPARPLRDPGRTVGYTHDRCQRHLSKPELAATGSNSCPPKYPPKCRYMMEIAVKGSLASSVEFRVEALVSYTTPDESERPVRPHPCAKAPKSTSLFTKDRACVPLTSSQSEVRTRLVFPSMDDCVNLPRIPFTSKLPQLLLCNETIFQELLPSEEVVVRDRFPGSLALRPDSRPRDATLDDVVTRETTQERQPDWPESPMPHTVGVLRPVTPSDLAVSSAVDQFVHMQTADTTSADETEEGMQQHSSTALPWTFPALEDRPEEDEQPFGDELLRLDDHPEEHESSPERTHPGLEDFPEEDEQPFGSPGHTRKTLLEEWEQHATPQPELAWTSDMLEDRPEEDDERPLAPPTTLDSVDETKPRRVGAHAGTHLKAGEPAPPVFSGWI